MSQRWPIVTNFCYFGRQLVEEIVASLNSILHYITTTTTASVQQSPANIVRQSVLQITRPTVNLATE